MSGLTVAWFHCFAGIAGDMALGSLLDAGAELAEVVEMVRRLPVRGWDLTVEATQRGGIAASRAVVRTDEDGVVRTHSHIVGMIEEARLPSRVRDRALATFGALAEVEGRLHRRDPAHVHFHEVGGLDAIVDVVGTCAALETLGVDAVAASAVATGSGMVRSAHGLLPNPAPAVVALLRGAPTYGTDVSVELTTPTGAALLTAVGGQWGPMPAMTITRSGFGAGRRDLPTLPNRTQVVIGETEAEAAPTPGQPVALIETNLDDATGETLAHTVAALLEAGALDAWVAPVLMKKGRPGHVVSALADLALAGQVARAMQVETGTLGVRFQLRRAAGAGQGQPGPGQGRARRRRPGGAPHRAPAPRGRDPGRAEVAARPGPRGRRRQLSAKRKTTWAGSLRPGRRDREDGLRPPK